MDQTILYMFAFGAVCVFVFIWFAEIDTVFHNDPNFKIKLVASRKPIYRIVRFYWKCEKHKLSRKHKGVDGKRHILWIEDRVDKMNKNGAREPRGEVMYVRKSWIWLGGNFGVKQWERYIELFNKCSLPMTKVSFNTMLELGWSNAGLSSMLHNRIEGLTYGEQNELAGLIKRKWYKQGQRYMPWEYFFMNIYEGKNKRDFRLESEMEELTNNLDNHEPNPEKVLNRNKGIYVGGGYRFAGQGNFLTIGGARSGKGVNLIIPQLLDHEKFQGSTVIVDVKGEASAICAKALKEAGKNVIILDPWGLQRSIGAEHDIAPSCYNPLDILKSDYARLSDDCDMLAEMLIPIKPELKDDHWDDKGRQFLSAFMHHMASFEARKDTFTLSDLRTLVRLPMEKNQLTDNLLDVLAEMKANPSEGGILADSAVEIFGLQQGSEKEFTGVMSNVQKATDIFKSPDLRESLSRSDFELGDLRDGNTVLFICIPPDRLATHNVWLRLLIGSIISTLQRQKGKPVLLIMDEFYSLGYFKIINSSMGLMPGYDIHLWPILQDLGQLKQTYDKSWETFIANAHVTTWLGIRDNTTSEYLSTSMGSRTVRYLPDDKLMAELEERQAGTPIRHDVRVQSPNEIRENEGIYCLAKGLKAMNFKKQPYYRDEVLNRRASKNPYFTNQSH